MLFSKRISNSLVCCWRPWWTCKQNLFFISQFLKTCNISLIKISYTCFSYRIYKKNHGWNVEKILISKPSCVFNASARVCLSFRYLAGADSAAVKAGLPVFSVTSNPFLLWAVAAAARTRRTHAVVASREVHTHAVIPAGVCLQTAFVDVWKTSSESE